MSSFTLFLTPLALAEFANSTDKGNKVEHHIGGSIERFNIDSNSARREGIDDKGFGIDSYYKAIFNDLIVLSPGISVFFCENR